MKSYKFLEEVLHKIRNIENTLKILSKSRLDIEDKIQQMCFLEEIKHEIISHDAIKESLTNAFSKSKSTTNTQQLKLIEEIYKSNSVIPVDLVKSLVKTKIECQNLRMLVSSEISNLEKLKERFSELIKLIREVACIKSQQLKYSKYDSLLANYDSIITEKNIKEIFPKLGKFFSENIEKVIQKQKSNKIANIQKAATQKQVELASLCLQQMNITPNSIYTSYYDPIDYDESDFCHALFLLLRHSGYAVYQKCLAQNSIKSYITKHVMYETQGLFMEKIIGTSREFIEFIQPHIKEKFAIKSKNNSSVDNLYLLFNKVNLLSLLKNSDEFTLLAHIMLRTKLEQNIINDNLEVKDLHDAWLEGMKHYKISIKAKNELDTYFQDEYWVSGTIGYFPIKIIALIAAVQFFSFIKNNHYECLDAVAKGNFTLLINWFSQNIYTAKCDFLKQLKKVTGKHLDIECCTCYLSEKYILS